MGLHRDAHLAGLRIARHDGVGVRERRGVARGGGRLHRGSGGEPRVLSLDQDATSEGGLTVLDRLDCSRSPSPEDEVDLEIVPLAVHPLYVAARSGHPLATHPDPTMEKLLGYPIACISRIPPRVLEPMRAAQRRSTGTGAALPVFPAIEFNSLSALNEVVRGSVMSDESAEVEMNRIVVPVQMSGATG